MKKIKKLFYSLKYIFLIYIIQFLVVFISSAIYLAIGYNDLTKFLGNQASIILILVNLIIIILLLKKYNYKYNHLPLKLYYPLISLGVTISCLLNMLIYLLFPNSIKEATIPLYISIISSGIIGPILEETLFRYILFEELNKFLSPKKALLIATIIFALVHRTPVNIFYALILGGILNIIYYKTNNIIASFLVHSGANIIAIFLTTYNSSILYLSIIGLIISSALIYKNGMKSIF